MRRGFSLAEIMVSLFLLSLAMLGLISAYVYSLRAADHGRERDDITQYATQIMGEIEAVSRRNSSYYNINQSRRRTPCGDSRGQLFYAVDDQALSIRMKKITLVIYAPGERGAPEIEYPFWLELRDLYYRPDRW